MIVARYIDNGKWGYIRVRLEDGRILPEHRFVMEQHLGHKLERHEHVHHKNGNKHNNKIKNLELTSNSEHSKIHAVKAETTVLICPACGEEFTRTKRYIRSKTKLGQTNFLCSRKCRMPKEKIN